MPQRHLIDLTGRGAETTPDVSATSLRRACPSGLEGRTGPAARTRPGLPDGGGRKRTGREGLDRLRAHKVLPVAAHIPTARYIQSAKCHAGAEVLALLKKLDRDQARAALEEALQTGPQTAWSRRLAPTSGTLAGTPTSGGDNDRLFLARDEWRREAGVRLDRFPRPRSTCPPAATVSSARARLPGSFGGDGRGRLQKAEQSASDCRCSWPTPRRSERRIWEAKTAGVEERKRKFTRDDDNQLLGQRKVEKKYAPKTRLTGSLLDASTEAHGDATEAARDRIRLVNHEAVVRLYDVLADRLRTYATRVKRAAPTREARRAHVEAHSHCS